MRIEQVELFRFAVPLVRPLSTAKGEIRSRRGWIVRLRGRDGSFGLGEAARHPHAASTDEARDRERLGAVGAIVRGVDASRIGEVLETLGVAESWIACGFDVAAHDLLARSRGVALVDLLGGARRRRVPVNALLQASDLPGCVAEAEAAVAAGFTHAKRKVGVDPRAAAAEVTALAATVPSLALRLDANGVWTFSGALAAVRLLDAPTVEWIEQPLSADAPDAPAELARLRKLTRLPIAVDESIRGPGDVDRLMRAGACDAVVVKLEQVGGLTSARRVVERAAATDARIAVTSGIDTSVGLAAACALAAAAEGRLGPCGLATGALLAGDVARPRLAPGPTLAVPSGPGLGVDLDPEALERFAEEAA